MLYTLLISLLLLLPLLPKNTVAVMAVNTVTTESQAQGAKSLDELGNRLHQALQSGSVSSLTPYLIDKEVYNRLQRQSPAQLRETLMLLSPENIMADFQREFGDVVRDGVTAEINWAQTTLGGTTRQQNDERETPQGIIPAILTISDQNNAQVQVNFEAVEVDGRYYFFQQMRLGNTAERF